MAYTPTNWKTGDVITAGKLNNMESGIADCDTAITDLKEEISELGGLSDDVKQALLQIASKVAYIDENGQDYYDALETALYPQATLVSISAVYTQSGTVYDTDSLDSLKADLVVTATYDDSTTETVTTYTLSGTLTAGTSTITVSYGGKTTTFTVTVTAMYDVLSYVAPSGEAYINTDYIPDENTKIIMDYQSDKESGTTFQCPLGATKDTGTSAQDHTFFFYIGSSNTLTASVSLNGGSKSNIATIAENSRHTYELSNADISIDSVSYGIPRSTDSELALSGSVSVPFYVFARNHGGTLIRAYATGKCYELSIYSGNTLVRHYVPRKRNSDNEYGLLDTVNSVFYTGTGTITGA